MKVDRSRIVDEALRLLNEAGLAGLSTRELARRLGVQQPALYWHFRSKRALLDAMNIEILARGRIHRIPSPGERWDDFLVENARSYRAALMAYRDGAKVHAGTEIDSSELEPVEAQMRFLVDAGMSATFAMDLLVSIGRYVVGCVLEEQAYLEADTGEGRLPPVAVAGFPLLGEALRHYRAVGHAAVFETGLRLILEGARKVLDER